MPTHPPKPQRARVIADSISPDGHRVTTLEVTMHRFVLAELNTHRVFSRNSASSRAIPVRKQIARVVDTPATPVEFGSNKRGMQAGEPLTGDAHNQALDAWLHARDQAVAAVQQLQQLGVHKQVTNRLLEPFMWHTVIVTATDWDGFFEQRCSPLAQPEIRVAAEAMQTARAASTPTELDVGQWHTPYVTRVTEQQLHTNNELTEFEQATAITDQMWSQEAPELRGDTFAQAISAARCARVSYLTHDGVRDTDKDINLYQRLVSARPPHWSPLEHVTTPCDDCHNNRDHQHLGNLTGWSQLRHQISVTQDTATQ